MGVMAAPDFSFKGHKYIMKKVRVVSLARDTPSVLIYASTKYYQIFQTIKELWRAQEFGSEIRSGEITKRTKQELLIAISPEPIGPG